MYLFFMLSNTNGVLIDTEDNFERYLKFLRRLNMLRLAISF